MDPRLQQMVQTVHYWLATSEDGVTWQDIYNLYSDSDDSFDPESKTLAPPDELGLFKKIDSPRKKKMEGGYERGYYFFLHPDYKGESKCRVVIRTSNDRVAFRLMERIVPDIVDNNTTFRGVHSAKVIGGEAYASGKPDHIVIYAQDQETQEAVVNKIMGYRSMGRFSEEDFCDPLPVGIQWKARGLGVASQPPNVPVLSGTGGPSFGKYLSQVLAIATKASVALLGVEGSYPDFEKVAIATLRIAGIQADHPDIIGGQFPQLASVTPIASLEPDLDEELLKQIKATAGV